MKALRIPYIISIIFYLYMGVIVMPAASRMLLEVSAQPECVVVLDLEFMGFNRETVLQTFSCMGEEGLAYYTKIEKLQDVFYPLSYGLFFGLTIFFLGLYVGFSRKRAAGFAILPLITTFLDFIENMGLLHLVSEYPAISAESVNHASTANQFKWIFAVISFTLLFGLAIWALKVRFTKARSVV